MPTKELELTWTNKITIINCSQAD